MGSSQMRRCQRVRKAQTYVPATWMTLLFQHMCFCRIVTKQRSFLRPATGIIGSELEGSENVSSNAEVSTSRPSAEAPCGPAFPMDTSQMRDVLRGLQDNPGMLEQMRAAVTNMSPEQIQEAVSASLVLWSNECAAASDFLCISV